MNANTILIIDDEPQIRKMLEITLQTNGFNVREASTGKEGLSASAIHPPDLILLDLGLPDMNGHEVLKKLREWYTHPIIILSVQSGEEEIIHALDEGANDYLVKPFRSGELLARIRNVLRNSQEDKSNPIIKGKDLEIDLSLRTVKKNGEIIKLTATEYNLLSLLVQNERKVLTHQFVLKQIWGPTYINESQYLRVYIAQIRKKIESDPNRPVHLITESGVGYRFLINP